MTDDSLRQFYVRAARTLSIASEVYQELKKPGRINKSAITRLRLELRTWQDDLDAREAYNVSLSEFRANLAIWTHAGQIGAQPEPPSRPSGFPDIHEVNSVLNLVESLKFHVSQVRDTIKHLLGLSSLQKDLSAMSSTLGYMGQAIGVIKVRLDTDNSTEAVCRYYEESAGALAMTQPSPQPAPTEPAPPVPIVDELVTLDQVAPLAGLSKRSLERYLSAGALPQPDRPGGNGRAHKWYWNNLREQLSKVARLPLPERFPGSRIS